MSRGPAPRGALLRASDHCVSEVVRPGPAAPGDTSPAAGFRPVAILMRPRLSCLLLPLLVACAAAPPASAPDLAPQRLRGMYLHVADTGLFTECRSAERLLVLTEGDNAALEREFLRVRRMAGVPVLATVEGRIEQRVGPDGGAPRRMLHVERFVSVTPGEGCSGPQADAALENTYWRLSALFGMPVAPTPAGVRERHLVLQGGRRTVSGFGGCNRLAGSFTVAGDRLSFGPLAGTRMACPNSEWYERDFLAALEKVARWRIAGPWLELSGEDGSPLALFEAVYLR